MMFYGQDDLDSVRRLVWGRLFGQCVEKTREAAGRSVEEAAHLAGMEASEWSAVEAGFVPDPAKLRPMADALAASIRRRSPPGRALPGGLGAVNLPAAAPDQPGHWRRVLTIPYAHLQRKEVSQIKTKEGTGLKRLNVNISEELHRSFKSATAAQGLEMTDVLLEFIQKYVDKNGPVAPKKSRRA